MAATEGWEDVMGWANCGTDSRGRPIGYAHSGACDHAGCESKIDRGLDRACGGMHGPEDRNGGIGCEGYFCSAHLYGCDDHIARCAKCAEEYEATRRGWTLTAQGYVRGLWRIYHAQTWCCAFRERFVRGGFQSAAEAVAWVDEGDHEEEKEDGP